METDHKTSQLPLEDVRANLRPIKLWSSPEHLRLIELRREDVRAKLNKPNLSTDFDVFLPLPSSITQPPQTTAAEVKQMIKTKGAAASPPAEAPIPPEQAPPPASDSTLPVPHKSLTTLRTMFPSTADEHACTIDWDASVIAMTDAGFSARNGGGSMVVFEKDDGRIVFHKPHPVAKIDPAMFQAMGRRMNRWFGWCRQMFIGIGEDK